MKPYERDVMRWRKYRDERARERVVKGIWDFVYMYADRFSRSARARGLTVEKDDLAGAAWPSVLKAIDSTWEPKRGEFTTVVGQICVRDMMRWVRKDRPIPMPARRLPDEADVRVVTMHEPSLGPDSESPVEIWGWEKHSKGFEDEWIEREYLRSLLEADANRPGRGREEGSVTREIARMLMEGKEPIEIQRELNIKSNNYSTRLHEMVKRIRSRVEAESKREDAATGSR